MPWYAHIPVMFVSGLMWYGLIGQVVFGNPFGSEPASNAEFWLMSMLSVGLVLFFFTMRLITQADETGIIVRFTPLKSQSIPYEKVIGMEIVSYHLLSYGGLGLRWSPDKGWAYIMGSRRGLKLQLADGAQLLIGSRQPEELLRCIERYHLK